MEFNRLVDEFVEITACVACDSKNLQEIIDLGPQPLANDFRHPNDGPVKKYPLELNLCRDCFHSQLSVSVSPDLLFRNYLYTSGTTQTLLDYFQGLKRKLLDTHGSHGMLIEIASNDGTFLSTFNDSEWRMVGIDPALNLLESSHKNGVVTIPDFFNSKIARLFKGQADAIVAMNVLAHVSNPKQMIRNIEIALKEDGIAYIQTSQADMFQYGQFDTIYHEHISFFNVNSMSALLAGTNLHLQKVEIVPIHGNSYLWQVGKFSKQESDERLKHEENIGLYSRSYYQTFYHRAQEISLKFLNIVKEKRMAGFKLSLYGAAAKGNTFLNFIDLAPDYIFDDAKIKVGRVNPAGGVVIESSDKIEAVEGPLLHVISAWNFEAEIKQKISEKRKNRGDEIIVYFPEIRVSPVE